MARKKSDDEIFTNAKNKLGKLIEAEQDANKVIGLVNSLVKMKAVELKMSEGDWGEGLSTPADEP